MLTSIEAPRRSSSGSHRALTPEPEAPSGSAPVEADVPAPVPVVSDEVSASVAADGATAEVTSEEAAELEEAEAFLREVEEQEEAAAADRFLHQLETEENFFEAPSPSSHAPSSLQPELADERAADARRAADPTLRLRQQKLRRLVSIVVAIALVLFAGVAIHMLSGG